MNYKMLGDSDLQVSRICLGCMGFGDSQRGQHSWTLDEDNSREVIRHALESGINFFDTAIGYQSGTSEQYLGRALNNFSTRDKVVVATKFLPRTQDDIENRVTGQQHITRMIDKSLQNLGMDYVDLYIYHMWDYNTPVDDILEGLNNVIKSGKARYIGIANCFAWQLSEANAIAEREGWAKFISIQNHYNLIFREEEREMTPFCESKNIAMTPYSALASGRLSRRPGETSKRLKEDRYAQFKYGAAAEQDQTIICRVSELADRHGVSMTEVAISWLLTRAASPIVGATKAHHIDAPVKATSFVLTSDEISFLEEPYLPHKLVGVMAQNKPETSKENKVWSVGDQNI